MSLAMELGNIYKTHGRLTPTLVVEEASAPDHPLHTRFEWDDTAAGARYRLIQAQGLIRSVRVTVEQQPDNGPAPVRITTRAFVAEADLATPISSDDFGDVDPGPGGYIPVEAVAADPALTSAYEATLRKRWQDLKRAAVGVSGFIQFVLDDIAAGTEADCGR